MLYAVVSREMVTVSTIDMINHHDQSLRLISLSYLLRASLIRTETDYPLQDHLSKKTGDEDRKK